MPWRNKIQSDEAGYYPAADFADLAQDKLVKKRIRGLTILLTLHLGKVYAFSADCPHAAGNLAKGHLYKGRIDCPEHAYRFDIASGRILWPTDETYRLKSYPIKVVEGAVHVKLP